MGGRLMVVAADATERELSRSLSRLGYDVFAVTSAEVALSVASRGELDVVLVALDLPGGDGHALCHRITAMRRDLPVVVVCPEDTVQAAVSAVRAGAFDVIGMPLDAVALGALVERALVHGRLARTVKSLKDAGVARWLGV